jgi:hypothetical protein
MKNKETIIVILVALVAAAAGFFGGIQYQKQQKISFGFGQFGNGPGMMNSFNNGQNGSRGNRNGMMSNRQTVGKIINTDDKSITVELNDGSSRIVILSDSTSYSKADPASKADLKTGERVAIFGTTNTDGSVTAQMVQLNPLVRGTTTTGGTPR